MDTQQPDDGTIQRASERPLVLIVEDDLDIANLIRHQLAGNYLFAVATTGAEALRIAAEQQPDAITLDLGLPDLRGDVVLRRLGADPRTHAIPVIVISVRGDEMPADLPASAVLTKPVNRAALRRAMATALESPSRQRR